MGGLTSHLPPHGAALKGLFAPVTWSCLSLGQPFPSVMRERCPTPPNPHAPRSSECDHFWKQGLCPWNQLRMSGWSPPGVRVGPKFRDLEERTQTDTLRRPCRDRQGLERCSSLETHRAVPGATRSWNRQEGASRAFGGSIVLPTP